VQIHSSVTNKWQWKAVTVRGGSQLVASETVREYPVVKLKGGGLSPLLPFEPPAIV